MFKEKIQAILNRKGYQIKKINNLEAAMEVNEYFGENKINLLLQSTDYTGRMGIKI